MAAPIEIIPLEPKKIIKRMDGKSMAVKRALSPATNATGLGSAAAAIYAAVVMIWNVSHHQAAIDPQVVIAAIGAAAFLYTRFKVTPVADPRDGNGQPLVPAPVAAPPPAGPPA
jgi:hypothetical protein